MMVTGVRIPTVFFLLSMLFIGTFEHLFAQNGEERTFRRISRADGLSNDEVFCILQDRNGIMWFGTPDGLNAYDGTKFTVYRHREGDSTSLPQNIVTHITEDANGNLWAGTKDYVCRFIQKGDGGVFVSYRLPTRVEFHYVRAIMDAGDGRTMYVVIGAGLLALDTRNGSVRNILDERLLGEHPQLASRAVLCERGNIWVSTIKGLFVYERQGARLRRLNDSYIVNAMPRLDREGHLWYHTADTIFVFDPRTERVVQTFPKYRFSASLSILENAQAGYLLCQSLDDLIWFQFRQTVWTINPRTGEIQNQTVGLLNVLNNSGIACGFSDKTGVLWLGDNVRGLAVWSPYKPKFRLWRHNPTNTNSLSHDYIRGIWEDPNRIAWVCTQFGGLNRIDHTTGEVRRYRYRAVKQGKPQIGLVSDDLWGILPLGDNGKGKNNIWLYKELFCQEMNTATERFRSLPIRPTSFMVRDREGAIWTLNTLANNTSYLGTITADGIHFLPKKKMTSTIVRLDAALQDRRGRLWFALFSPHISRYDKSREMWDTLRLTPPIRLADMLCSMTEDRAGNVWITTKGDGVYMCDTNDRVVNITEKDGLPNNNVYGVFEDAHGAIWFSCDKGIVRYNPATKQFRQYTPDDGLQGWEFNRMAFHQTKRGNIYFGGTDGLNLFHPDSLRDNPHPPPVKMTAIRLADKPLSAFEADGRLPYQDVSVGALRHVELPHDQNTLGFEFAALDFTAPKLNKYSWKLEGFDKDWCEPTSEHSTKYTNLAHGSYTFFVRACNNDGVWNENGLTLTIAIQPAWYQRWWFYGIGGTALILAVFGIVRVRVRAVEARNRLLEVEVHNRTKELRIANNEIQRQLEVQDEQAKEIELRNTELSATLQDLKSTQSQLVQSERMNAIGMLTAGVMHEINNPNAIVYAAISQTRNKIQTMMEYFLSLLDEESKTSGEVKIFEDMNRDAASHLELAANGSKRIRGIVANLQGFTKHQEDGRKTGNLTAELGSTIELFRLQFKNVQVECTLPNEIMFSGNFGELNQVFLNLLVNAAQAGATVLRIEGETSAHGIKLSFSDNGPGMSEQVRRRIFEPFFSTKGEGNSGLGLSISKQIVERHGGTLTCESVPGSGTVFRVELPPSAK